MILPAQAFALRSVACGATGPAEWLTRTAGAQPNSGVTIIIDNNAPIGEDQLAILIPRFYARVREDPLIGPVFNAAIGDWEHHLNKIVAFWSSVMLTSGRYKGNPVAAHFKHLAKITPPMFDRWLAIWAEVTDELLPPEAAAALQVKAARIAESLKLALYFRLAPASGGPTGPARPVPVVS